MLDADARRDIEDLKREIKFYENEEESLMRELETLRLRKSAAREKLKKLSDDSKYQQDMLEMVYKQRHNKQ